MKNRQHNAKARHHFFKRWPKKVFWGLGAGSLQLAIALSSHPLVPFGARPTQAAERITFSLGATIERTISVESIEIYVEEGRITDELAPYVQYIEAVDPNALSAARQLLSQRADIDATTVAQFAYTPQGEYLLGEIGKVFRTGARLPGGKGLRGAAILSAADEAVGLTILNVIKRFPTPVLRVDLQQGLAIANQTSASFKQSAVALDLVEQIALQSVTDEFPPGVSVSSLSQLSTVPGAFSVQRLTTRVKASGVPIDIYLPRSPANFFNEVITPLNPAVNASSAISSMPTVIISHGFGNERKTYGYLAEFLASHGFAVINLEHPGSSAEQFNALVSGRTNQVVPDDEFIRRPQLITEVLNELQQRAVTDKTFGQIDFNNVGVVGQSFGGYTALAVAGAPVSLSSLRENCPPEFSINVSVLLQCQAVNLGPPETETLDFLDPRIQAVVAINPMTSLIFGPESLGQVQVPVLMMTASGDTVAPALPEQVYPFTWLTMPDRYLLLLDGATHFSTIAVTGEETFQLPPEIFGPVPDVAQRYTEVMTLAFLSIYLKGDSRYQSVLTSRFTTFLSEPEMPLSIISDLEPERLVRQLRLAAEGNLPAIETMEQAVDDLSINEGSEGSEGNEGVADEDLN